MTTCVVCNAETWNVCGGCKYNFYCSNECVERDWAQHCLQCTGPLMHKWKTLDERLKQTPGNWQDICDVKDIAEEVISRLDNQDAEQQRSYHHKLREDVMNSLTNVKSMIASILLIREEGEDAARREAKQTQKAAKKKKKKDAKKRRKAATVVERMEDLDLDNECVVCMDAVRQVRNMPCGHEVMCQGCAAGVLAAAKHTASCPYCGQSFFYTMLIK